MIRAGAMTGRSGSLFVKETPQALATPDRHIMHRKVLHCANLTGARRAAVNRSASIVARQSLFALGTARTVVTTFHATPDPLTRKRTSGSGSVTAMRSSGPYVAQPV